MSLLISCKYNVNYIGHRAVAYPNMSMKIETLYRPNHQPDKYYELIRDDLNEIFDVTWYVWDAKHGYYIYNHVILIIPKA